MELHTTQKQLRFSERAMEIKLGAKQSSLFDISAYRKDLHPVGSSITSFAWEPHEERKKKQVAYENTYRMEPPEKFRPDKVKPIIQEVLNKNLEGKTYDPVESSFLSKSIAEDIKNQVRDLDFKRYKIVTWVIIGQKKEQGVRIGSRFLWDADRDSYASCDFSNRHLYATGVVYAVYYE